MVLPNVPLPSDAYVPILKGKRAELHAIAGCSSEKLVPLIEFLDPSVAGDLLARTWRNPGHVVWFQVLNPGGPDEEFTDKLKGLLEMLRSNSLPGVPVVTTTEEPEVLAVVAHAVALDGIGCVLRIDVEDLVDEQVDSTADIESTLDAVGLESDGVDLVLDAGLLTGSVSVQVAVVSQALRELPYTDWRSLVVAFSAFPAVVGEVVQKGTVAALPREDAAAFVAVRRLSGLALVYSDYAVGVPTYSEIAFSPIPNIRYASDADWHVHRGHARANPSPQYRELARAVVAASYYSGVSFSPGDREINDVASGISGPGNATTHLRAAMSRHLHLVLSRLANLGAP